MHIGKYIQLHMYFFEMYFTIATKCDFTNANKCDFIGSTNVISIWIFQYH